MSRVPRFKDVEKVAESLFKERILELEAEVAGLKDICRILAERIAEFEIGGLVKTSEETSVLTPKEFLHEGV